MSAFDALVSSHTPAYGLDILFLLLSISASLHVMSFYGTDRWIWVPQVGADRCKTYQSSCRPPSFRGDRGRPVHEPKNMLETCWHKKEVSSKANQGSSGCKLVICFKTEAYITYLALATIEKEMAASLLLWSRAKYIILIIMIFLWRHSWCSKDESSWLLTLPLVLSLDILNVMKSSLFIQYFGF